MGYAGGSKRQYYMPTAPYYNRLMMGTMEVIVSRVAKLAPCAVAAEKPMHKTAWIWGREDW